MKVTTQGLAAVAALASALTLTSCAETDVVGQVAVTSFDAATRALGDKVIYDEKEAAYRLSSPSGDVLAIAQDFSRDNGMATMSSGDSKATEIATMEAPDFEIETDAKPFLDAGLDPTKLVKADMVQYLVEDGMFMIHFDWGSTAFTTVPATATTVQGKLMETFRQILGTYRANIGYHEKLDHYGFALGDGNMVEWAKDLATNDKDLVFVLNPEPLIKAGVDPTKVAGWVFAKVEVKDAAGKAILVDKLLRPFNLK